MTEREFNYKTPLLITTTTLAVGQAMAGAPYSLALGPCAFTDQQGQVKTSQQIYCTQQDRECFPTVLPLIQQVLTTVRPYLSASDFTRATCWLTTWSGVQFL